MLRRLTTSAALLALTLFAPAIGAQTVFTEDAAVVGDDTVAFDRLGRSVSLSGDVLIASFEPGSAKPNGATVFRRVNGTWTDEASFQLTSTGTCDFGRAVAVDGPLAAVSDPVHDFSGFCSGNGLLMALHDAGGGFAEQGTYSGPTNPFPVGGSTVYEYGASLAIRGDHMVAGTPSDPLKIGIVSQPVVAPHDWDGRQWVQGTPFTGSMTSISDCFGAAVALSADGGTLVVGARDAHVSGSVFAGEAYVFRRARGTWTQEARLVAPDGMPFDHFGAAVAVNDDGSACAVGATHDDTPLGDAGSVYVYRYDGSSWSMTQNFGSPVPAANGWFGGAMSMAGSRLVVASPPTDGVFVYRDVGTAYVPLQRLQQAHDTGSDWFGGSMSLDGDRCAVSALSADSVGTSSGVVYVYELPDLAFVADVDSVPPGGKVTFVASGGVPATPCVLTLELRSVGASLGPVAWGAPGLGPGVFGPEGRHTLAFPSLPGLAGLSVAFRAYGQYEPGIAGSSNAVTVGFD